MTATQITDRIIAGLSQIDSPLSGDDSPLLNTWEEIKQQLQHGLLPSWGLYLATIKQFISAEVKRLNASELASLSVQLRCPATAADTAAAVEKKLLSRLFAKGKREQVRYAPFDFVYFSYPLFEFTVYCEVIERTGLGECYVRGYSCAAPNGEIGAVQTSRIERLLTQEQFEAARQRGWA